MITEKIIVESCADLEERYVDYLVKRFAEWEVWATASRRIADREPVRDEEIPEAFYAEMRMMRVILEMEDKGSFDWNNPRLREIFEGITREPFYAFFGEMITMLALRLADSAGCETLLEIGAGKANLTNIMLRQMKGRDRVYPLVVTDAQSVILENIERLQESYSHLDFQTLLWDITEPPPEELCSKLVSPVVLYERYTLNYATLKAFENIARVADILVLGDWFNHTGKLYAYDEVFKKIGARPLFFSDVRPLLDRYFPHYHIFDQRAVDAIQLPNITLLIAWK